MRFFLIAILFIGCAAIAAVLVRIKDRRIGKDASNADAFEIREG